MVDVINEGNDKEKPISHRGISARTAFVWGEDLSDEEKTNIKSFYVSTSMAIMKCLNIFKEN